MTIETLFDFPPIEEINFISPPQDLDAIAYHDVRKYMMDYFSKSDDILSLYEFGTVKAPSISDIDLLIVLKDNPSKDIHKFIKRDSLHALAQYLMMDNTLMLVNELGFKNIPLWDDMEFRLLCGKKIEQTCVPESARIPTEIARVMDWLPERTMRMMELIARKEVPTRATLCLINSFIYVLQRLKNTFNIRFAGVEKYVDDFAGLRRDWFRTENNHEILYAYLQKAIEFGFQALHAFNDHVLMEGFYDAGDCPEFATFRLNPKITSWTKQKMHYHFTKDASQVSLKESHKRSSKNNSVIVIPMTYYQHLLTYGLNNEIISSRLLENLNPQGNITTIQGVQSGLQQTLKKRMQIIDEMALFLKQNSMDRGLLKFGWFL